MNYAFQNFYEALQNNAKLRPKKNVLLIGKEKINNLKLKSKVDIFANYLANIGIKKGDKIALILENCEEFVISIFAIAKLGAITVPVNNFLKFDEFNFILNNCKAKLLLSSEKFIKETRRLLDETNIEKIIWVGDNQKTDEQNVSFSQILKTFKFSNNQIQSPTIDDTACIIYTSGTTGKPKGAMLSYKNIFSNIYGGNAVYEITPKDRFIIYLPMFHSFTFSIMTICPLVLGASIVIVKSIFPFSNVLKEALFKRVTIFMGVPTIYNALNKAKIPWYFMWFNKIRVFLSGASALNKKVHAEFTKKFKKAILVESYGLSECSPAVAFNPPHKQKPLSVGLPLPGYEVKIVDNNLMEVKTGEVGEIIIKGDCVMQGYYGYEDTTESVIINGWLRTGDLGKVDEDGYLYIVDRIKDLIISKGINIYPREIEEVLIQYEGIEAVAVVGQKDENSDEDIVAFVQLKDGYELIHEKILKNFLKKHLANYKIPNRIYTVEELPKNATGKVLKRVLKDDLNSGKIFDENIIIKKDQ